MNLKNALKKIFLLSIIMVLLLSNVYSKISKKERAEYNAGVEKFLEEKYDKTFTVLKSYKVGNAGFGTYMASDVICDEDGIEFSIGGGSDNYLTRLWSAQGSEPIRKRLEELYGDDFDFSYDFSIGYPNQGGFESLDYEDAIKRIHENDIGSMCTLVCFIFTDGEIDKTQEAENIFSIYETYIQPLKTNSYLVSFTYVKSSYMDEYWAYEGQFINSKKWEDLLESDDMLNRVFFIDDDGVITEEFIVKKFIK